MEEISIPVGSGKINSSPIGYKKIIGFYLSCNLHHNTVVFLDFTQLIGIDGNMCAMVMAVLHKLNRENNLTFSINKKNYNHIKINMSLLFSNGFLTDFVKTPYNKTAVLLTSFGIDEDEKFLNYITHDLLENDSLKIADDKKNEIIDNFLEVFSNVPLHAKTSDPIFACGQYFAKTGYLHFTLVDLGNGYLPAIEEFTNGKVNTAEMAIKWALTDSNTTKKDAPRGTGLKNLLKFCKETDGQLAIMTGDSHWSTDEIHTKMPCFCGTTIQLIFNCKN